MSNFETLVALLDAHINKLEAEAELHRIVYDNSAIGSDYETEAHYDLDVSWKALHELATIRDYANMLMENNDEQGPDYERALAAILPTYRRWQESLNHAQHTNDRSDYKQEVNDWNSLYEQGQVLVELYHKSFDEIIDDLDSMI